MKKNMIYAIIPAVVLSLAGCSKDEPRIIEKDWNGTTAFYSGSDSDMSGTYYKPYAGYVGDPMPFYDPVEKDFKVLYLQDYRPNAAGTYHPIWGVSTSDAANYVSLGELIPCGGLVEQDAAIGTGSTVYNDADGLYYTFYTGNKYEPSADESGQVVMLATSSDFRKWTKNRTLYIKGEDNGYGKNDFRDPFVFAGEDGLWHMMVSTVKNGKGVLAEYISENLLDWQHAGVFMTMMWDRFYECPDIFKMGDWWYLVYSEMHSAIRKVQYFKGRTLDELRRCTENDAAIWPDSREGVLDSRGFYAGKTASNGVDRYIWGWCPTRPGNDNTDVGAAPKEPEWAGNLVAHRLVQNEDGTLMLAPVEGIVSKYSAAQKVSLMEKGGESVTETSGGYSLSGESYALFNRLGECNRISFTVKTASAQDKFGISLVRGSDSEKYYTLVFNPEDGGAKRKINFEEEGKEGIGFIGGIDGYLFDTPSGNTYNITIFTDNSVCVVYVDGIAAYTNRIYGIRNNCWSVNSYGGDIEVLDIEVYRQK